MPHQAGNRLNIKRGGHNQNAQIRTQNRLTFKAKRQSRICCKRPFMKFVKNDAASLRQFGIFL